MKLDPFYLIVDSAHWVERLVPIGVRLVQLRIKERPDSEVRSDIRIARTICDRHGCQLVVNDHWRVAIDEGCDFVHLGQEDLAQADVAAIRGAGLKLGISTHDEAELDMALSVAPDYVALGPVYPTVLKKMKWAPQGLARLTTWRKKIGSTPLVAIGGLNIERIDGVLTHGADCAAVVTDITRSQDPEGRTGQWIAATSRWRTAPA
ncbi:MULTISPECIES: thiamine phosphate synthase [unclassified Ensifer]|uniref:thiamine phosphate synthase n=1 Tax=unclassified Ensifer TaxID=2633371 RepID=UPI0007098478|nr:MULTISPECIES: thiamine phosphate synthase [unclassified Ensifer]KQW60561.1 thiamine-phosphate pyrophosphorylase [Ensifer sp. Root1252]KRC79390.1 thiamine-phosphate pyrophosphorylase [Ensifer sp. Root231]KRC99782.1 thiamine-phosphate pyrophosphorylase [Ensifer sp. Root258]